MQGQKNSLIRNKFKIMIKAQESPHIINLSIDLKQMDKQPMLKPLMPPKGTKIQKA